MIVDCQFLESRADASTFLKPADALFHDGPAAIGLAVEGDARIVSRPFMVLMRNDRLDPAVAQPVADPLHAVALIRGEFFRSVSPSTLLSSPADSTGYRLADDRLGLRALVDLPRRDFNGEGSALAVSNHMELRSKPASAAAQRVVRRLGGMPVETFLSAPPAARAARTLAPSTHQSSQSIRPRSSSLICKASIMDAKTPVRRHCEKYRCTVLQEPKRSGRSRQGAPVPRIQKIPLSISRGSFAGRPVRALLRGIKDETSSHCSSVSSCRFMRADLHVVMETYRRKPEF